MKYYGISFTVLDENLNPVEFKLAIISRESLFGDDIVFDLGYISENGYFTHNVYSGGNTGFGVNNFTPLPKDYKIITTDIEKIKKVLDKHF